jgi:hypothetical protein
LAAAGAESAAVAAQQFAENFDLIGEAEGVILQQAPEFKKLVDKMVTQAAALFQADPTGRKTFDFLAFIVANLTPELAQEVKARLDIMLGLAFSDTTTSEQGGLDNATSFTAGYVAGLDDPRFESEVQEAIRTATLVDLTDTGVQSAQSFMDAMFLTIAANASRVGQAAKDAVERGLEISSPSKVMERVGVLAGQGLIQGFLSVANRPIPALRNVTTGTSTGTSPQVTVNNVINHPTAGRLSTDVALLDQLTGAAGALLRSF